MDAAAPHTDPVRVVRPRWVWAGGLLIVGTLIAVVPQNAPGTSWLLWLGAALVAAAWILLAVGRDRAVASRLAVVALFVLALWPLASTIVWTVIATGVDVSGSTPAWLTTAGTIDALVPAVAAIIAAVDVWRGGRVPRQLRMAPLIAAGLCVVPSVAVQVVATATIPHGAPGEAFVGLSQFGWLCGVVAFIGLGVVSIVSGVMPRHASTAGTVVFPPAD